MKSITSFLLLIILWIIIFQYQKYYNCILHDSSKEPKVVFYRSNHYFIPSINQYKQKVPIEEVIVLNHTDEQGHLFDELMKHILILQRNISVSQSVIIYQANVESGLGNVIIGMVSSLISALATNRGFQMIPFVVYDFFYEPLPNFYYQQHSIPPKDIQSYFFYPLLAQGRAIRRNHLNRLTRKKTLLIDCFTDVTPHFLENPLYQSIWETLHLWKDQQPHIENVVSLLYELVMYPKQPLCQEINYYLDILLKKKLIAVQVRVGGRRNLYDDKQFLELSDIPKFYTKINDYLHTYHLAEEDVYLFVSTDDPTVITMFKEKYPKSVFSVNSFSIGHSSPNKNRMQRYKVSEFTKRAIIDLLILQRADYLLYTNTSSYGYLASQLQRNRNSSVIIDDYVNWSEHKDHCSVFERSSRPYFSELIGHYSPVA